MVVSRCRFPLFHIVMKARQGSAGPLSGPHRRQAPVFPTSSLRTLLIMSRSVSQSYADIIRPIRALDEIGHPGNLVAEDETINRGRSRKVDFKTGAHVASVIL